MNNLIFIYITNPTKAEARKIAKHLLKKNLIGCANIYSGINSLYPWKGGLADETEYILITKTIPQNWKKIQAEVERIHSYTIPCIVKIPTSANKRYAIWLRSKIKKTKK